MAGPVHLFWLVAAVAMKDQSAHPKQHTPRTKTRADQGRRTEEPTAATHALATGAHGAAWPPGQMCAAPAQLELPAGMVRWAQRGRQHMGAPPKAQAPAAGQYPAALVLRGRAPTGTSDQEEVAHYYRKMIVRPLTSAGYAVDAFIHTYLRVDGFAALAPVVLTTMPEEGSSNLQMSVASMLAFVDFCRSHRVKYDVVVLTRLDLRLKLPLLELPGYQADAINFVFRESWGVWRKVGWPSVHLAWDRSRRVGDAIHVIPGSQLVCFLLGLTHYANHPIHYAKNPREQLHYLYEAVARFTGRIAFLVNGSYDSNPAKGMLNPVYDIIPRSHHAYNSSLCRTLADFKYDAQSDSHCCANPAAGYCCPNSVLSCPNL